MSSKQCTKKITLDGQKVPFNTIKAFVRTSAGWKRIRSKADIPATPDGTPVTVVWKKGRGAGTPDQDRTPWNTSAVPAGRTPKGRAWTGESGLGYQRTTLDELSVLAATFRAGATFYESADERSARLRTLAQTATSSDPDAVSDLVRDLRTNKGMRTASIAIAIEAAFAGHPQAAALVQAALQRPDDPGLALQYCMDVHGRIPSAVRNAVGAAAVELYDEQAVLRYDRRRSRRTTGEAGNANGFRFADVLRVTHPRPLTPQQEDLFGYLVGSAQASPDTLPAIYALRALERSTPEGRIDAYTGALSWAREVFAGTRPAWSDPDDPAALGILTAGIDRAWQLAPSIPTDATPELQRALDEAEARQAQALSEADAAWAKARSLNRAASAGRRASRKAQASLYRETASKDVVVRQMQKARDFEPHVLAHQQAVRVAKEKGRAVRDAGSAVRVAQDNLARAGQAAALEASLPRMSSRSILMHLADLDRPEVSAEARQYARERVASSLDSGGTTSLSDVIRAAKAAAESSLDKGRKVKDHYWASPSWLSSETHWDSALDSAVRSAVGTTMDSLAGKRVLVLVDGSGSMFCPVSTRKGDQRSTVYSDLRRDEVAAFVAAAIAGVPDAHVDVVAYDTTGTLVNLDGGSALSATREISANCRGGGTDTIRVTDEHWNEHDLIVTLTDEQAGGWGGYRHGENLSFRRVPESVPMVTCNLAGDAPADREAQPHRVTISGMTDAIFDAIGAALQR